MIIILHSSYKTVEDELHQSAHQSVAATKLCNNLLHARIFESEDRLRGALEATSIELRTRHRI